MSEQLKPIRMALHYAKNSGELLKRGFWTVEQRFNVAAQDRQRRAQFVRNVRHEIPPHLIHLFELGDVVKQNQCAGDLAGFVLGRDGMQLDLRTIKSQLAANRAVTTERIGQEQIERGITDNLQQRRRY